MEEERSPGVRESAPRTKDGREEERLERNNDAKVYNTCVQVRRGEGENELARMVLERGQKKRKKKALL